MEDVAGMETMGGRQRGCSFAPEESSVPGHAITPLNFLCDPLCFSTKAGVTGRERRLAKSQGGWRSWVGLESRDCVS